MAKKRKPKASGRRPDRKVERPAKENRKSKIANRKSPRIPAEQRKGPISAEVGYGRPPAEHQFRPGESGNPAGTPPARSNLWRHICRWLERPEAEIRRALKDKALPANQRIAAKQALQLLSKGFVGVALPATLRMWDRDEGRPVAHVVLESQDILSHEECEEIREQQRRMMQTGKGQD